MAKKPSKRRSTRKERSSLWDWTLHGVTQTSLTQWLNCREQFSLGYIEGWTPRGFSVPLEFGNLIHLMLQHQVGSSLPEKTARKVCKDYEAARKPQLRGTDDYQQMQKTIVAAEALFPRYVRFWTKDDLKQKWIGREKVFKVEHKFGYSRGKFLNTKWIPDYYQETQKVLLNGMRDGEYRTLKGKLGLFETKTKGSIDDMAIHSGLRADLQTMFYMWSLYLETGEWPTECLYNVIRRPGLIYNPKKETLQQYGQRIGKDIDERPEYYFRRWHVTVLQQDLEAFIRTVLDPALRLMFQWWESIAENPLDRFQSPYHFVNLAGLSNKYGRAPLYELMILNRRESYFRRSSLFPELQGGLAA